MGGAGEQEVLVLVLTPLQVRLGTRASAGLLVSRATSWALCCTEPGPGVTGGSGGPSAASLLVGVAVSSPS